MTVTTSIDPARLLEEQLAQASPDLLRELLGTFINTLLSAEADAVCRADYGEVGPARTNRRNGYRTATSTPGPAPLRWRSRNYAKARTSPKGCWSVVGGQSGRSPRWWRLATCSASAPAGWTSSSLGITSLSQSQVSEMAKDLGEHVQEFRTRRLTAAGPSTLLAADALV